MHKLLSAFKKSGHTLLAQSKKMKLGKINSSFPIYSEEDQENPIDEIAEGTPVLIVLLDEGQAFISPDGENFQEVSDIQEGDFAEVEELPEDSILEEETEEVDSAKINSLAVKADLTKGQDLIDRGVTEDSYGTTLDPASTYAEDEDGVWPVDGEGQIASSADSVIENIKEAASFAKDLFRKGKSVPEILTALDGEVQWADMFTEEEVQDLIEGTSGLMSSKAVLSHWKDMDSDHREAWDAAEKAFKAQSNGAAPSTAKDWGTVMAIAKNTLEKGYKTGLASSKINSSEDPLNPEEAGKEIEGVQVEDPVDGAAATSSTVEVTPTEVQPTQNAPDTGNGIGGVTEEPIGTVTTDTGNVESGEETKKEDAEVALVEVDKVLPEGVVSMKVIPFKGKEVISSASSVYVLEALTKDLSDVNFNIHREGSFLVRGQELKNLFSCSKKWVESGNVLDLNVNKTVVFPKDNQAYLVRSSRFTLNLIRASLIPGINNAKYTTFTKLGKSYISQSGHVFDAEKMQKMGYPKYVVIAQSVKGFFDKTGVVAGNFLESSLAELDKEYFNRTVNSYKAKIEGMQKREAALRSSLETQAKKNAALLASVQKEKLVLRREVLSAKNEVANQKRINSALLRQNKDAKVVRILPEDNSAAVNERASVLSKILGGSKK